MALDFISPYDPDEIDKASNKSELAATHEPIILAPILCQVFLLK